MVIWEWVDLYWFIAFLTDLIFMYLEWCVLGDLFILKQEKNTSSSIECQTCYLYVPKYFFVLIISKQTKHISYLGQ